MERNDNVFDRKGRNDLHWTATTYHDGKFYMFYNYGMAPSGPTPLMTGLAVSENGKDFSIKKDLVLSPSFGAWDSRMIEAHSILRADGKWRMYYCGFDGSWRIGYAESNNMTEWRKGPGHILDLGDAQWENMHVADPHVIFFKGKYLMYYMGKGDVWQIGVAESKDGIEFDKSPDNPIGETNQEWCNGCLCLSGVMKYKGRLLSAIHGYNTNDKKFRSRLFVSNDGYKFEPLEIEIGPGKWANRGIVHPEIVRVNDRFFVFYTGIRQGSPEQHIIGRVILDVEDLHL